VISGHSPSSPYFNPSFTLSLSLILSFSLYLPLYLSFSLLRSHSLSRSLSLTLSLSHSRLLAYLLTCSLAHSLTLALCLIQFHSLRTLRPFHRFCYNHYNYFPVSPLRCIETNFHLKLPNTLLFLHHHHFIQGQRPLPRFLPALPRKYTKLLRRASALGRIHRKGLQDGSSIQGTQGETKIINLSVYEIVIVILFIDCASSSWRFPSDFEAIAERLQSDCKTILQCFRSDNKSNALR
jgi:hypothetical protein